MPYAICMRRRTQWHLCRDYNTLSEVERNEFQRRSCRHQQRWRQTSTDDVERRHKNDEIKICGRLHVNLMCNLRHLQWKSQINCSLISNGTNEKKNGNVTFITLHMFLVLVWRNKNVNGGQVMGYPEARRNVPNKFLFCELWRIQTV